MKEQKIYQVVAAERVENLIEATGVIQGISRILLCDVKIPATSSKAAELKALAGKEYDPDNLEVKVEAVNFPG